MFSAVVASAPWGCNPVLALVLTFILAYLPHFLRKPLIEKKLKELKIEFQLADSRFLSSKCVDDSPLGRKIAAHIGCHQNGLEAFVYFSISILSAIVTKVDRQTIEKTAGLFLLVRSTYTMVYLSSLNGAARSFCWIMGVILSIGLMVCAMQKFDEIY
jgi:uncharacterized MAPEG superfamily protein